MAEKDVTLGSTSGIEDSAGSRASEAGKLGNKESTELTEPAATVAVATPVSPDSSASATIQIAVDRTLHFLSHANNQTLGACLVGLGATTYLLLGRLGILVIGVAGGVVLQATWEGIRQDERDENTKEIERQRRRENAIDVASRILKWRDDRATRDYIHDTRMFADQPLSFSNFGAESAKALDNLVDAAVNDYVYYWYGPTIPGEDSFPTTCKRTLQAFILSLAGHLERKRPADVFLDFTTNTSSIIIVLLNELAAATNTSPHSSAEDAVATYLKLKPDSSLSYILDQKSQTNKLVDIAEDVLQAYLDAKSYNCLPVHVFLREVLAKLILGSTIALCSRPEWINEWIVYGLEESETASKVMDIVDAGVEGRVVVEPVHADDSSSPLAGVIKSRKEGAESPIKVVTGDRRRHASKAEEAMDEAMREAKRLTQLMIEEDERRAREEQERQAATSSSDDVSDANETRGVPTPASSHSGTDRADSASGLWSMDGADPETPISVSVPTSLDTQSNVPPPQNLSPVHATISPTGADRLQAQLTLHQANISIFDDSVPGERTSIKAKPTTDYLIQIEPSNSSFSGWMIQRKYVDFENLHEVLRRISVITGVTGFTQQHNALPSWKSNTKVALRTDLEKYLVDAVKFQPLAESEGMKRFLDKSQGLNRSPSGRGFGWPTPDAFGKLGGEMVNALAKAPKQMADGVTGGGKAMIGGVTGGGKAVLGGVAGLVGANKRTSQSQTNLSDNSNTRDQYNNAQPRTSTSDVYSNSSGRARASQDSLRMRTMRPTSSRQMSSETVSSLDARERSNSVRSSIDVQPVDLRRSIESLGRSEHPTAPPAEAHSLKEDVLPSPIEEEELINLPPPPSQMPEDYESSTQAMRSSTDVFHNSTADLDEKPPPMPPRPSKPEIKAAEPLTDKETSVAVELMFAVVTELYTLSSAWNFRRTLLTAAKTFLLRPGNPQLMAIRDLLQHSLIEANLSDSGLATHIQKLRENALPTEKELQAWQRDFPEKTPEQKEQLRIKARRLLVTKGMPQALTSVMGAAASGEALGKVFDCLQVESVGRGLVFGLMLQAMRVVTH